MREIYEIGAAMDQIVDAILQGTGERAIWLLVIMGIGWAYREERKERRENYKDFMQLSKDQIQTNMEIGAAIDLLVAKLGAE